MDAEDEYGNIYVTWQELYSSTYEDVWVDVFCTQAEGTYCSGKSTGVWEGATQLDTSYYEEGNGDVAPDIAVSQTGTVCVSWGSSYYDDVWIDCYYSGAWTGNSVYYATDDIEITPSIAFDESGYVVLAIPLPSASDSLAVCKITVSATPSGSCVDYTAATLDIYSWSWTFPDNFVVNCLLTAATTCAILYNDAISSTDEGVSVIESSNDFASSITYGPATISSETWSTTWKGGWFGGHSVVNVANGGAACSTSSADCAMAFDYDSGDDNPNQYVLHYAYTTNGWDGSWAVGNAPTSTASISVTALTIIGAGSPVISWNTSSTMYVSGSAALAPASSAAWGTDWSMSCSDAYMCMPGLAQVPESGSYNLGNNIPWRVDVVYSSADATYYQFFWGPAITSPSSTEAVLDIGQSTTLSTSIVSLSPVPEGFTIPATGYTWGSLPTGCASTAASFVCSPTGTGTFSVTVYATDTGGFTSTTMGPVTVKVNAALSAGAISPAAPTIDNGQSITLTSNPSGGTTPYGYQWYTGAACASSIGGATGSTYAAAPTTSTTYSYRVTDSASSPNSACSAGDTVTVNPALVANAVTPGSPTIDDGQSITLTANPSGGTLSYSYQWYYSASNSGACTSGTAGGTSSTYLVSPVTSTYYCYHVGDSSQGTPAAGADSGWDLVTVNEALSAGPISPSAPTIDNGQSILLTSNPSGGTSPYSYQWYTGASCNTVVSGATASTYSASPASTTTYSYKVTDSAYSAESVCSSGDTVTVNAALSAGAVSPSSPGIDNGQSITLTANPSGGTPSYSYQWYSSASSGGACTSGTPGPTTSTYAVAPASSTYYCYHVGDSSVGTPAASVSSGWDLVTVNPALSAGAVSPSAPTIDDGQAITLTANPSGGTPGYTYQWYSSASSGGACTSGTPGPTTSTYAPSPGSSTYYCYKVGDSSAGTPAASATSGWDLVTVNSALVAGAITPSAPSIDDGQTLLLTANPSGGTPSYTIDWYTGAACNTFVGGPATTLLAAPSSTTTFTYLVTDSAYNPDSVCSPGDTITVNPALGAGAVTPSAPAIDAGQSVLLTSHESGGTAPLSYLWYSSTTGSGACSTGTSTGTTSSTYSPSPASDTYYCYVVSDSSAAGAETAGSAWDLVTVNADLSSGAVTPSSPSIDDGQSITLTANPSGGTAPYTYQWYSSPSNSGACTSGTAGGTSATYAPSPSSSTYYCYKVGDSSSGTPAASATSSWDLVTVNSALVAGAISPSAPSIDSGQSILLTSSASGGTSPYSYQWYTGAGCSSAIGGATSSTYSATPTSTTTYTYKVTDSAYNPNSVCSGGDTVTVNSALASGSVSPTSPTIDDGQSITLTANPSGGTSPYTYQWYYSASNSGACTSGTAGGSSSTYTPSPATNTYYCYKVGDSSAGTPAASATSGWDLVTVNGALAAGATTPGSPVIDDGQSVTLTSHPSGGTTPYTYQWYYAASSSGACTSGTLGPTTATYAASPSTSTYYCYHVADASQGSPAAGASSTWDLVTVNAALASGSASPTSPTIDNGQSITLTANPSGGTTPYAYQWYSSASNTGACDLGTPGGTASTATVSPGSSTYYCYHVTDASTGTPAAGATSGWDLVTVNPTLSAGAVSPASPTIDDGQTIPLTANPTGGTSPYSFQWYSSATGSGGCSSGTPGATTVSISPAPASSTYYCYTVGDASTGTPASSASSGWDQVKVNSALGAGAVSPSGPVLDDGQSITLSASASGGTPAYTYQWYFSLSGSGPCDTGTPGGTAATYAPSPATSEYFCYAAGDASVGTPAASASSGWDLVTVNPALVAGAVSPSGPTITVGEGVTLTANPSGGTPSYTYQWYSSLLSSGACSSGTAGPTTSTDTSYPSQNTYYCYEVDDASVGSPSAATYSGWDLVTVNGPLSAGPVSPAAPLIDVGQSITLTATPSGGTSPYTYQWYSASTSGGSCSSGTAGATTVSISPAPTTNTYYCYVVTDSTSAQATSSWNLVVVDSALGAGALTPASPTIDSGQSITLTANPSGGTPSYTYQWYSSGSSSGACDLGTPGGTGSTFLVAPATATYYCYVAGDSSQGTPAASAASGWDRVLVSPALAAGGITPGAPSIDAGQTITLTSNPSGGTAPYGYQWYTGASCASSINGATLSTLSVSPGSTTSYAYKVTDSAFSPVSLCSSTDTVTVDPVLVAGSVSPTTPTIDDGQSISLSANPSGGTTPYTYQWYASPSNSGACSSGTAGGTGATYAPSPASNTYYCYTVGDSSQGTPAASASSGWDLVKVDPALASGSATPSSPKIDDGQSITLTANPSGGTTPYTYQWYFSATNTGSCSSGTLGPTSSTYAISPPSSTYYCYIVGDASSGAPAASAASAWDLVTVNPVLAAGAVTPGAPTIDDGQSIVLTANPSGGTAPYTYVWYSSSSSAGACTSGTAGASTSTLTVSPVSATYYCYALGDSSTGSPAASAESGWDLVSVNPTLVAGSATPASPTINQGQPVTLTANPSAGTQPYSYQWYSSPLNTGACSSGTPGPTTSTYTSSPASNTYYCYEVGDSSTGTPAASVYSAWDLVTVNGPLTAGLVSPVGPAIDTGQSLTLTANPSGGTQPYSFAWYAAASSAGACTSGTASGVGKTISVSPTSDTYYCYQVTDATSASQSTGWDLVTVDPALVAGAVSPSAPVIDSGQSVTLSANPSGGTPAYTYQWYSSSSGSGACLSGTAGATTSTLSVSPTSTTYYCYVLGDSSVGTPVSTSSSGWDVVTVHADPTITLSATTPKLDLGETATVAGSPSGGTSPYTCRWYVNGTLRAGSSCASVSFTASTLGPLIVNATLIDTAGFSVKSGTVTLTVSPHPAASVSPGAATADAKQHVTVTATIVGGSAPFTCQWYLGGAAIPGATSCVSYVEIPPSPGTYVVGFSALDSAAPGLTAFANSTLTVGPAMVLTLTPTSTSVDIGMASPTFTVGITGGLAGFTYAWLVNAHLQAGATTSTFSYTAPASGSYLITAQVTDANGDVVFVNATLTVNALPTIQIAASATETGPGVGVLLTAMLANGTAPETVDWWLGTKLVGSGATFTFSSATTGTFQLNASVMDTFGRTGNSNLLSVQVVVVQPTGSGPSEAEVGGSFTYTATGADGVPPYTYQWAVNGANVSGATSPHFSWTPSAPGTAVVSAWVMDAGQQLGRWTITVSVVPAVQASLNASAQTLDATMTTTLTAGVAGGLGPFTYTWLMDGTTWNNPAGASSYSFAPSTEGTYRIQVKVSDPLDGVNTSAAVTLQVASVPTVSVAANATSSQVGWPIALTATVLGGTGPFSFVWTYNGTGGIPSEQDTASFEPTGPGTYTFTVVATDAVGKTATSTPVTVDVSQDAWKISPNHVSSGSGGFPLWLLLLVVAAVVGALLVLIVVRRRRRVPEQQAAAAMAEMAATGSASAGAASATGAAAGSGAAAGAGGAEGASDADLAFAAAAGGVAGAAFAASGAPDYETAPTPSVATPEEAALEPMAPVAPLEVAEVPVAVPVPGPQEAPGAETPAAPAPPVVREEVPAAVPAPASPTKPAAPTKAGAPAALSYFGVADVHPATRVRTESRAVDVSGLATCSRCGSPLPTAKSECLVCAASEPDKGGSGGAEPEAEREAVAPPPWMDGSHKTSSAKAAKVTAAARPTPSPAPTVASAPPAKVVSAPAAAVAAPAPAASALPSPPVPPAPAPPTPAPAPGPVAAPPAAAPPAPAVAPEAAPKHERPTTCYVCGSGLDESAVCPVCGIQW